MVPVRGAASERCSIVVVRCGRLRYLEPALWLTLYPGVALTLAVLAFNLLGDTLRGVLEPRLRGT